jgi:hypothetical protein
MADSDLADKNATQIFKDVTDEQLAKEGIIVRLSPGKRGSRNGGWTVWYLVHKPTGHKRNSFKFDFSPVNESDLSKEFVQSLAERVIKSHTGASLTGLGKADPRRVKANQLRSQMFLMNTKVKRGTLNPDTFHTPGDGPQIYRPGPQTSNDVSDSSAGPDKSKFYEKDYSLFKRQPGDGGKTTFFAGRSYSGKTYLLAEELNKLAGQTETIKHSGISYSRPVYSKIIIMTSSPHAEPLKKIDKKLNVKIVPLYLASVVQLMKRINDAATNHFPFLICLDDVFDSMKGHSFKKLILTLRNSNISTVTLSQAVKHALPELRNSFHQIAITKFNCAEWDYYIGAALETSIEEILGANMTRKKLAKAWTEWVGQDIVLHNNREDRLSLIERNYKKG